jgi:geranylgeranyl pyrophosphate synthase
MTKAEILALAIALLSCGAALAINAVSRSEGVQLPEFLEGFHRNYIKAACGQFMDANLERRADVTTDDALRMTISKSGSLGRLAAEIGARLATRRPELVRLCQDFGENLFTYAQLLDDVSDILPNDSHRGDLVAAKKTLPAVYFHNHLRETGAEFPVTPADLVDLYQVSGAEAFCGIVAEIFRNRALSNLKEMADLGVDTTNLEVFVTSLTEAALPAIAA